MDKPDCRKYVCQFHVGNDTERTEADGEKFVAQGPSLHCVDMSRGKKHKWIFLCKTLEQERLTKACLLESTNHCVCRGYTTAIIVTISVCEH